jgi:membrane protein implicated in regulation of membrane protease activity|tara:strand:- start:690 stop:1127 length:438 start_codon:yes stop_codon:yes gene_type:complete
MFPETYWIVWTVALATLGLSALVGETFLPWLAVAIASAGLADFLGAGIDAQFFWFSLTLIISVLASRTIFRQQRNTKHLSITETTADMIGGTVTVLHVDKKKPYLGEAQAISGRLWRVEHETGEVLVINQPYVCKSAQGISLKIK